MEKFLSETVFVRVDNQPKLAEDRVDVLQSQLYIGKKWIDCEKFISWNDILHVDWNDSSLTIFVYAEEGFSDWTALLF